MNEGIGRTAPQAQASQARENTERIAVGNFDGQGSENAKRLDGAQRSQIRENFDGRRLPLRGEKFSRTSLRRENAEWAAERIPPHEGRFRKPWGGIPFRLVRRQGAGRAGFTLVELLVALVIMASLVAVASVSVETTQNKARADKTAAIGRGTVEALERSDGLSFVSDFGRLPQDAEELMFLFSQKILAAGVEEEAAPYREIELTIPSDTEDQDGNPVGLAFRDRFNDLSPKPALHAGWRGPYSRVTELGTIGSDSAKRSALLDGWKNEWGVVLDGGEVSALKSPGRNGVFDPGDADWQDKDLPFPINRSLATKDVALNIRVRVFDNSGNEIDEGTLTDFALGAVVFFPKADPKFAAVDHEEKVTTNPSGDASYSLSLTGLTVGHRMVFVFASGGGHNYASIPKLLHVKPGVQPEEVITLTQF